VVAVDAGPWLGVILHTGTMQDDAVAERGKQARKRAVEVEAVPAATTANDSIGRLERVEGGGPLELDLDHLVRYSLDERAVEPMQSGHAGRLDFVET
jgi:hypothetical protein